jgi:hypothetical protein
MMDKDATMKYFWFFAFVTGILGCNEVVPGTCRPNTTGGAGGADSWAVGAGVGATTTTGTYGADPPKDPLASGDGDSACSDPCMECPTPADAWLNCKGLDAIGCMRKCADAGASCASGLPHPYKPEVGLGDLYRCKTGVPTHTCSYYYANGDECVYFSPFGMVPWCVYIGAKP